ncbi:hypothetical protein GGR56DRAFT_625396 [Xylariaceae sp. FL0804]|nr:hypothetical protein GGR56DRAFT_625396 [Xylariaceae sp. FL0804]
MAHPARLSRPIAAILPSPITTTTTFQSTIAAGGPRCLHHHLLYLRRIRPTHAHAPPRRLASSSPSHHSHVSAPRPSPPPRDGGNPREQQSTTASELERRDVLAGTPPPATAVDVCAADGFALNSGARVGGGAGVLLVNGEAFAWRPWLAREGREGEEDSSGGSGSGSGTRRTVGDGPRLLNARGQWHVPDEALGLLSLLWPRPDLLILGVGPEMRPVSPALRRRVGALGVRLEVLDTRNAAAQYNLLATERGVADVAAALVPIGWREGRGASYDDE